MEYTHKDLDIANNNQLEFIMWLHEERFLNIADKVCSRCNSKMYLQYSARFKGDSTCLHCSNNRCLSYTSIRHGSFFRRSNLPLKDQMCLLIQFVGGASVRSTALTFGYSRTTVSKFFKRCRKTYQEEIHQNPIRFEDFSEYEVDETMLKNVFNALEEVVPVQWIAGILEQSSHKVIMYRTSGRKSTELLPSIRDNVQKFALLYSDELTTYHMLDDEYAHYAVNHSQGEYVRAEDIGDGDIVSVHINTLERVWRTIKPRLKPQTRRNPQQMDLILDEYMYRYSGCSLFTPFKVQPLPNSSK